MYALVKMYIGLWTQKQKRPGHVFWITNKFYVLEQLLKYTTSEPTSVFGLALLNNKKSYPLYVSTFPYGQPGDAMWMDRPLVLHQNNSNSTPLPKPFPPEESLNKPVREQCWLIIHSFSLSLSLFCLYPACSGRFTFPMKEPAYCEKTWCFLSSHSRTSHIHPPATNITNLAALLKPRLAANDPAQWCKHSCKLPAGWQADRWQDSRTRNRFRIELRSCKGKIAEMFWEGPQWIQISGIQWHISTNPLILSCVWCPCMVSIHKAEITCQDFLGCFVIKSATSSFLGQITTW